jgi:uncharacterized membrane protein
MDLSSTLKFLHVLAAVLWVGGGFAVILTSILMIRRSTAEAQLGLIRATLLLGPRLFIPTSLITLTSGLALMFVAGWGWQPFTVLGLAGVVFTAGFGGLFLAPSAERVLKIDAAEGAMAALPQLYRLQRLALWDYSMQFAIVFLMVVKPGWQDFAVFSGLAAVLVLAGLATLRPLPRVT